MTRIITLSMLTGATVVALVTSVFAGVVNGYEANLVATETFWGCPAGFTFETSGNAAHCKRPATIDRKLLGGCPVGLFALTDRIGTKDMCGATNPVSGEISIERACKATDVALGYTKRIVTGTDYCGKALPPQVEAPSRAITVTL